MIPALDDAQAVLSIGGDNYSLDYGVPRSYTDLDDIVLEKRNLWYFGGHQSVRLMHYPNTSPI
jgi:hypothetical protein